MSAVAHSSGGGGGDRGGQKGGDHWWNKEGGHRGYPGDFNPATGKKYRVGYRTKAGKWKRARKPQTKRIQEAVPPDVPAPGELDWLDELYERTRRAICGEGPAKPLSLAPITQRIDELRRLLQEQHNGHKRQEELVEELADAFFPHSFLRQQLEHGEFSDAADNDIDHNGLHEDEQFPSRQELEHGSDGELSDGTDDNQINSDGRHENEQSESSGSPAET